MLEYIVGIIGTGTLSTIGWAIRLASRVSVVDQKHIDLMLLIDSKFGEVNRRLGRIEEAMNGAFKH